MATSWQPIVPLNAPAESKQAVIAALAEEIRAAKRADARAATAEAALMNWTMRSTAWTTRKSPSSQAGRDIANVG